MNVNIVALGRVALVFVYITLIIAVIHGVGYVTGIEPVLLVMGLVVAYIAYILFQMEKSRVEQERSQK